MAKKYYTVTLTLPDGTRRYYRGNTKKEAEAKRDKERALMNQGVNIADNSTFQEIAEQWYYLFKEDSLHKKSKDILLGTLKRHVYPVLGAKKVRDIKPADVFQLMKSVSGKSNSLQRKVLQSVKAIFAFAVDNDLITRSPVPSTVKAGGSEPDEVEALTDAQCVALLDAVRGTRAYLFVELLLYTGLRRGEALGLMWSDIDFTGAEMEVSRSIVFPDGNQAGEINADMKTANAKRIIPIVPQLLADLKAERAKSKSLYVFSMADGRYLSKSSLRKLWKIITDRFVLEDPVHPHQLRHTCITRWIENGLDLKEVQYLAGHATAAITMNIYAHYRRAQMRENTASRMASTQLKPAPQAENLG